MESPLFTELIPVIKITKRCVLKAVTKGSIFFAIE
jgi:hypothetical protein